MRVTCRYITRWLTLSCSMTSGYCTPTLCFDIGSVGGPRLASLAATWATISARTGTRLVQCSNIQAMKLCGLTLLSTKIERCGSCHMKTASEYFIQFGTFHALSPIRSTSSTLLLSIHHQGSVGMQTRSRERRSRCVLVIGLETRPLVADSATVCTATPGSVVPSNHRRQSATRICDVSTCIHLEGDSWGLISMEGFKLRMVNAFTPATGSSSFLLSVIYPF